MTTPARRAALAQYVAYLHQKVTYNALKVVLARQAADFWG